MLDATLERQTPIQAVPVECIELRPTRANLFVLLTRCRQPVRNSLARKKDRIDSGLNSSPCSYVMTALRSVNEKRQAWHNCVKFAYQVARTDRLSPSERRRRSSRLPRVTGSPPSRSSSTSRIWTPAYDPSSLARRNGALLRLASGDIAAQKQATRRSSRSSKCVSAHVRSASSLPRRPDRLRALRSSGALWTRPPIERFGNLTLTMPAFASPSCPMAPFGQQA